MFFAQLFSYALLASTTLASPLQDRTDRHLSNLFRPAEGLTDNFLSVRKNGGSGSNSSGGSNGGQGDSGTTKTAATVTTATATSTAVSVPSDPTSLITSAIWSGAGMESARGTYESVTGTLIVPNLLPAAGGAASGYYGGSAWVGLDGMTCSSGLMAAGISFYYLQGTVWGQVWTQTYPNPSVNSALAVNPGDTVRLTVAATSSTAGTAVVDNVSSGESTTIALTSPSPLCLANAEWVVEDFQEGTFLIPFADFGTITFTDASATTQSGSTVGPSAGHLINMVQSNEQFTTASSTGDSVTVQYLTSIPF
ncbi:putative aspergillopepsin [Mycena sanguinolenta]|uniref:Putative aspergillopepsin n=1 Tax=Mycena sanguinolenta TaxID=230812 RepID=A0A8H7DP69_9AGAR|nr:putative aspergillopepsin [Mycena sanguinolenta]